jgi:hypothetical protein
MKCNVNKKNTNENINKEVCFIYFPVAKKFISLTNEDGKISDEIYNLIKYHPKLVDMFMYNYMKNTY